MADSTARSVALPYGEFTHMGSDLPSMARGMLFPSAYLSRDVLAFSSFIGRIPLILIAVFIGLVIYRLFRRQTPPNPRVLAALTAAAVFCLLWQTNAIARFIYLIPILNRFRWHFKLHLFLVFFLIAFAAVGFHMAGEIIKRRAVLILAIALIAVQMAEFAKIYAFTYEKPLSLRTWEDELPYAEPLADVLTLGRYVPVGFSLSEDRTFHTLGYTNAQLFGLQSVTGYEMLLPSGNYWPSLGSNVSGFYNDLALGRSEITHLNHFRSWGVCYYVVNNAYLEAYGPLPFGEVIYNDELRPVVYDGFALPVVFRADNPYRRHHTGRTLRFRYSRLLQRTVPPQLPRLRRRETPCC
jgi:hypothetical protein